MDGYHWIAIWAALATSLGALIALIKLWVDMADRTSKIKDELQGRIDDSIREREKSHIDQSTQIIAMQGAFGLYRESVAKEMREFITREMLRDFETRIERSAKDSADRVFHAIGDLTKRIDGSIGELSKRIDTAIEQRPTRASKR